MYSFCLVVLDLQVVLVCDHINFFLKNTSTNSAAIKSLGPGFYEDKQLTFFFL